MACDNVIITKENPENYVEKPNEEELKQSIYSPTKITDKILTDLFGSAKSSSKAFAKLFQGKDAVIPYKSVRDKTGVLKYFDDTNMPFGDKVGVIKNGADVRDLAIAITQLSSMAKSEEHSAKNNNLKSPQLELLKNSEYGTFNTSYYNAARVIGRDILKTRGYRLVPTNAQGLLDAANYETKVGEEAIQKLADRGLVTINKNGSVASRNFRKFDPESHEDSYIKESIYSGITTIAIDPVLHEGKGKDPLTVEEEAKRAASRLKATRALINPANSSIPSTSMKEINDDAQDIVHTTKARETLEQIQANALKINPYMNEALTELMELIRPEDSGTVRTSLGGLAEYIKGTKASPSLFGTVDMAALDAMLEGDEKGLERIYGKENHKLIQFSRLADHWDQLQDELYYSYQTANQNRLHAIEQTLNYQGDKHISRALLGSPEEQVLKTQEDQDYLISYLSDETGLTPEEIMSPTKNELLEKYLGALEAADENPGSQKILDILLGVAETIDSGTTILGTPMESAWTTLDYLIAIKDVRTGLKENKPIVTHFLPKPDATASGAVLTIFQAARYGGTPQEVAESLINGELKDAYKLAVDKVEENRKVALGENADPRTINTRAEASKPVYELMEAFTDKKSGIVPNIRELVKLPFTKFIYGQKNENNVVEISKELTNELIEGMHTEPLIKKILGDAVYENVTEMRALLEAELSKPKGLADVLVSTIQETTGDTLFKKQADELGDIHKLLAEAVYSSESEYAQTKILPPNAWLDLTEEGTDLTKSKAYAEAREEHGTVIDKYFETILPTGDKANLTTIKKRYPNENSIKVLLQHMTDAAILFRSLRGVKGFEGYTDGLMLNHDSIGATVSFARQLEPSYKEETMVVSREYDFIEAALMELKYAESVTTDKALKAKMQEHIAKVEAVLPEQIANKKAALQGMPDNVFGVKPAVKEATTKARANYKQPKEETPVTEPTSTKETEAKPMGVATITKTFKQKAAKDPSYKDLEKLVGFATKVNPDVEVVIGTTQSYNLATNTITMKSTNTPEALAHEVVHAATAQRIESDAEYRGRVQKIYNAVKERNPELLKSFEKETNNNVKLHEFMAAGLTNANLVNGLKEVSYGAKILNGIKKLVLKALGLKESEYNTAYGQLLDTFADTTFESTDTDLTLNMLDVVTDSFKGYDPKKTKDKGKETIVEKAAVFATDADKYASEKVKQTLDYTFNISEDADTVPAKSHKYLMENSKIYKDTFNAISDQWDENTFINKLRFYLDLDENAKRKEFNILNTQVVHAQERKNQFETDKMNELYRESKGLFSEKDTAQLYTLVAELPIASLAKGNILDSLIKKKTTIKAEIDKAISESTLTDAAKRRAIATAKELADFYVDKKVPSGLGTDLHLDSGTRDLVSKLSTLYGMEQIPTISTLLEKINSSKKHRGYVSKLLELSSAVRVLDGELYGTMAENYDSHLGNFNHTVFNDNIQIKHVTPKDVNHKFNEDLGWKMLVHPTSSKAGIMYRDVGDMTFQSGLATNLKMQPNLGLKIPSNYDAKLNNAKANATTNTLDVVFTNEQLDTMGLKRNPIDSLVKGYSHRLMLKETQSIREMLVDEFTDVYSKKTEADLIQKIKDREHLWYLRLPDGMTLDQLPAEIRAKYKPARASSDVDGFRDKVTLVRKDMADYVEGYKEIQIGETNTRLNKAFGILKKAILLQKIHWVVTAPAKIAMDATSNYAYLMSRNIPITTLYRKTKSVTKDMVEFTNLRQELLHAAFEQKAKPSKVIDRKVEKLENSIKNHRLATAYSRGFIQSIAIDLTQKNEHTAGGIHKDVGNVLTKVFRNDDKSLNLAGKAIMTLAKKGINGEDILLRAAALAESKDKNSVPSATARTLTHIAENIKEMKDKNDIENYLQEYMATPGSALVNVGSVLVQTPDVIAKVILHEHLVEEAVRKFKKEHRGRGPNKVELEKINEDAALESVTSFIDYKMNIPRELRFLEQTGITSFITFWSRIQKVMLVSLKNNPVNAITTIMLNEMLNLNGGTIFDANVIDKWGSGSLVGSPQFGMDVVLPTKVFG